MNSPDEVSTKPCFSAADAQTIAEEHFGIAGSTSELPGERDQNFQIQADHSRFVLKIANPQADYRVLELENAAIAIVDALDSIESPELQKSISGFNIATLHNAAGETCYVRCLSYVPGIPLAEFQPHSRELLIGIGRMIGEIDIELAFLNSHPAARRRLKWDLSNAPDIIAAALPLIESDVKKKELLELTSQRYQQIADRLAGLPRSVIHNDANDFNLLVQQDAETGLALVGLIDFGDIVFSTTINDLAICAAYVMMNKANPLEALFALVEGYHQSRRLTDNELSVLFPLIGMRLAQSVCVSASQRRLRPNDDYLTVSASPAWKMLERLTQETPLDVYLELSEVCSRSTVSTTPTGSRPANRSESKTILQQRRQYLSPSLSLAYEHPINVVRGRGQYLFDSADVTYLDCVNNVCHVGHCHPAIVRAASQQMELLNTNTRYLHENIVRLAKRLVGTLPTPLEICFLVNSGSEANDLALRLARAKTGKRDVLVIDHAYHGHTSAMIDISPYKFSGKGGQGQPEHVHVLECPDGYRGRLRYADPDYGNGYTQEAIKVIRAAANDGHQVGAFFAEAIMGCAGQIQLPSNYLRDIYSVIHEDDGVCIADEVQVGFGRVGTHFWGFQQHGVVPDIVTMGKPFGNGHPLAAVVTTREIADAFNNGMEYFNTFGGNPVSSAVGLAVFDVIEQEGLQEHALRVGEQLVIELRQLQERFPVIGDVRGSGLFLGIELVEDPRSQKPATKLAQQFVEKMKERRILLSTDGHFDNVIKFKPPMVFSSADADRLIKTMERELGGFRIA